MGAKLSHFPALAACMKRNMANLIRTPPFIGIQVTKSYWKEKRWGVTQLWTPGLHTFVYHLFTSNCFAFIF